MGVGLALTLLGGCAGGGTGDPPSPTSSPTAPDSPGPTSSEPMPTNTAPDSARVDLEPPTFSNPTAITNPLFPVSDVEQAVQLGVDAGETLRVEVTLLPETRVIEWNGQQIEARVHHFIAYLGGRIVESALDFYAQADDGSVWYLGEEVENYEDGKVVDNEGTWLAGRDGPAGMIMPADPRVGAVYRPENIPGFVFEEVTVRAVDQTVEGARGPVEGAIAVQELLMDGTLEDKVFAPGYGEFEARTSEELVTVAIAVPIDALGEPLPAELETLADGANDVFGAAPSGDWAGIAVTVEAMTAAWEAYAAGDVPPLLDQQMSDALNTLIEAGAAQDVEATRQAAIDVAQATLDLELRYLPRPEVDLDRLGQWARQLVLDAAAGDRGAVAGATLREIWSRVAPSASDAQLAELLAAAESQDPAALQQALDALQP